MGPRKPETGNSTKRRVVGLNQRLEKRLISYALAAGAAGVSVLACSPHAEAKVVFTNTWIPITPTTAITNIDLNGDGVVDFMISNKQGCSTNVCRGTMYVLPQGSGNVVWGAKTYASALASGVSLGSKGQFQAGHELMAREGWFVASGTTGYGSSGKWRQAANLFLGVKFFIQGQAHYGWVRVDVAATVKGMYGAISGYAYESVPNKPIKTGQKSGSVQKRKKGTKGSAAADAPPPSSGGLGQLAIGAVGLESWRKPTGISGPPTIVRRGELS